MRNAKEQGGCLLTDNDRREVERFKEFLAARKDQPPGTTYEEWYRKFYGDQ